MYVCTYKESWHAYAALQATASPPTAARLPTQLQGGEAALSLCIPLHSPPLTPSPHLHCLSFPLALAQSRLHASVRLLQLGQQVLALLVLALQPVDVLPVVPLRLYTYIYI
jgi:hypothetical protein